MRLDKYLAQNSGLSRKEVKKCLKAGDVLLNDIVVSDPSIQVNEEDEVIFDGNQLSAPKVRYLMLNKPQGIVCANDDQTHITVSSLIALPRAEELMICGRLDVDTTGLVLLTNDGQWCHRIISPRHKLKKHYHVTTADPLIDGIEKRFEEGIMLLNEKHPTKPASLIRHGDCNAEVCLSEGRYHQVKRMFAATGNRVVQLHRSQVGEIILDPQLEPGQYRELTDAEVQSVYA